MNLSFFIRKSANISSEKPTGQRISAMLSVFNILIHDIFRKLEKIALKRKKMEIFANFLIFGVILGSLGSTKKSPEISLNTSRPKLNSCEMKSMCKTFNVKYKFGAWQILFKKTFDLNVFISHMKYGRK